MRPASAVRAFLVVAALPVWSLAAIGAPPAPRIPLREGLTIVTAIATPGRGDSESIKTIIAATDAEVRLKFTWEAPASKNDDNPLAGLLGGAKPSKSPSAAGNQMDRISATRTIARQDLKTAHEYWQRFENNAPERYPGSTAIGVSASVLDELKTKGQTALTVEAGGIAGAVGSMLTGLLGAGSTKDLDKTTKLEGTLTRVEKTAVPFTVLVNDQPVQLPAIHARGQLGDKDAEFWILDDPENPLSLKWSIGSEKLQVIKLTFRAEAAATSSTAGSKAAPAASQAASAPAATGRIERDLEESGRSVVYGIYFDFASDRIKPESEPVLKEIAAVMTKFPTWTLTVEGHTDNIGATADNQSLSERRAAAVRQALGDRYRIAASRLVPAGLGESRPKATNDTLEGRAQNRRVELARVPTR